MSDKMLGAVCEGGSVMDDHFDIPRFDPIKNLRCPVGGGCASLSHSVIFCSHHF